MQEEPIQSHHITLSSVSVSKTLIEGAKKPSETTLSVHVLNMVRPIWATPYLDHPSPAQLQNMVRITKCSLAQVLSTANPTLPAHISALPVLTGTSNRGNEGENQIVKDSPLRVQDMRDRDMIRQTSILSVGHTEESRREGKASHVVRKTSFKCRQVLDAVGRCSTEICSQQVFASQNIPHWKDLQDFTF